MDLPETVCTMCGKSKINGLFMPRMLKAKKPVCRKCLVDYAKAHNARGYGPPGVPWREEITQDFVVRQGNAGKL